jgi:hypothetical protein
MNRDGFAFDQAKPSRVLNNNTHKMLLLPFLNAGIEGEFNE